MKRSFLTVLILTLCPVLLISARPGDTPKYQKARKKMVDYQIRMRGISNQKVLSAMALIPRHLFVPAELINQAYDDHPLPIGQGQTISQPYIVALMTESLQFKGDERVLEIGTGSGYQAAILAKVAKEVYTIEIKEKLFQKADKLLQSMDFNNVQSRHGDGYFGWAEAAPFDCIMITAAVDHIPPSLLKQLKDRGRLILPLGNPFSYQNLSLVTKNKDDYSLRQITGVLFVPMTGHALSPKSLSKTSRKDFP